MGIFRSCDAYMPSYATQSASDGAPNLGPLIFTELVPSRLTSLNRYVMEEPQPDNMDAFVDEEDPSLSRSGES